MNKIKYYDVTRFIVSFGQETELLDNKPSMIIPARDREL